MISKDILENAETMALEAAERYGSPAPFHIKLANREGQRIAGLLGADKDIVFLGTSLMDCALGEAMRAGKAKEHVVLSAEKAGEFMQSFPGISEAEKENILHCVREHHGIGGFHSIESEIVCNADCYRFISVEGVIGGMHSFREMEVGDLVKLWKEKLEEKWNALSLDICKKELEPQYKISKQFLERFKSPQI